jgi:flagellar motility protein MotE (MotC chaperone)
MEMLGSIPTISTNAVSVNKIKIENMETIILIASSVLTTLGIVLVIWLISGVRSTQKQLKSYDEEIPNIYHRVERESAEIYQNLENIKDELDKNLDKVKDELDRNLHDSHNDLDKRFDTSYRAMYELRDNIQSDVDRLIEKDLETNKSINK